MLFFVLYLVLFCLVPFVHLRCAGLKCVSCTELSSQYGDAVQGRVLGRPSCYPSEGLLPFLSCLLCFCLCCLQARSILFTFDLLYRGSRRRGCLPFGVSPRSPPSSRNGPQCVLLWLARSYLYWSVLYTCTYRVFICSWFEMPGTT